MKTNAAPSPKQKLEFIAKTITDLGKGIPIVWLASYFFERFPLRWRVIFGTISAGMIFGGILFYPEERGDEQWRWRWSW